MPASGPRTQGRPALPAHASTAPAWRWGARWWRCWRPTSRGRLRGRSRGAQALYGRPHPHREAWLKSRERDRPMRILVTNDDGIHAPGLDPACALLRRCPMTCGGGAGIRPVPGVAHSLSLSDPLRLREVAAAPLCGEGHAHDCVIMAVRHILETPPDLVLSASIRGQNIAEDVSYSGTVAGAIEGTILAFPPSPCRRPSGRRRATIPATRRRKPTAPAWCARCWRKAFRRASSSM